MQYPANITYSKKEKYYLVNFPDLPGCNIYAQTVDQAKVFAKEALSGYLESIDIRNLNIPKPTNKKGKNIYLIEPDTNIYFAIWLNK